MICPLSNPPAGRVRTFGLLRCSSQAERSRAGAARSINAENYATTDVQIDIFGLQRSQSLRAPTLAEPTGSNVRFRAYGLQRSQSLRAPTLASEPTGSNARFRAGALDVHHHPHHRLLDASSPSSLKRRAPEVSLSGSSIGAPTSQPCGLLPSSLLGLWTLPQPSS